MGYKVEFRIQHPITGDAAGLLSVHKRSATDSKSWLPIELINHNPL